MYSFFNGGLDRQLYITHMDRLHLYHMGCQSFQEEKKYRQLKNLLY